MQTVTSRQRSLATLIIGLAAVVAVLLFADLAAACPTCKDAMGHDPHAEALTRGYFWSILFMMSMPFVLFGGLGGYFYLQVRRAQREQAASVSEHASLDSDQGAGPATWTTAGEPS